MAGPVRVLGAREVRSVLDMAGCLAPVEDAFAAYSTGGAEAASVIHLDVPEAGGEIHIKAGHLHGAPYYAVKTASGFADPDGGPTVVDGMVLVFDARTGAPAAFLLDDGYLTDLRTGAAGGVAAKHLAPEEVERVAIVGTGGQARQQLDALLQVRPGLGEVRLWGRRPERAEARAADLRAALTAAGSTASVVVAPDVEQVVTGADVVVTCTAAREPLLMAGWLAPGAHVTAVGSDGAGKQELDPDILAAADLLVVDSREQCVRLGELQHAPGEAERAVELGTICAGLTPGRSSAGQLTVCDLTGLGVQDVAAANAVMAAAAERPDLGTWIEV